MEMDVNMENVCELFEIAPKLLGDQEFGLKFIEENTEEVMKKKTDAFIKLSPERMKVFLQDDKLTADEGSLFERVLAWADSRVEKKQGRNREDVFRELKQYIRWPLMEVTKIAGPVSNSNLLDQDELLSIFQYVAVTDEKRKGEMKITFNTKPRLGKKTAIVEWDGTQSFTYNLYTLSNKGRTARKTGSEGTIYILRAKTLLPNSGPGKHYWEVLIDAAVTTGDIQLGVAIANFSWTSAWLKSNGSYYLDGHVGGAYMGGGSRLFESQAFQANDRFGFLLDYKKQTLEVTRGKGKTGKLTKIGTFSGINQPVYPVFAARSCGNQITTL